MKKQFTTVLFLLLTALFFLPGISHGRIVELIQNETDYKIKADIKGTEIAKTFASAPRQRVSFSGIDVDIEIIDVKAIENGIEVLAKAWDTKGKSIGFGIDGSVEIERFKIYNPPILVEDAINGTIVREHTDLTTKEVKQRRLREDPKQAILETIAHNIKVVGKRNATVIKNKIGNTTSTFYPAAGAVEPVDGYTQRGGVTESWATIIAGAGTGAFPSASSMYLVHSGATTSGDWATFSKFIVTFDASPIPDGDPVNSVTLSLWGVLKTDPLSITPDMDIYTSAPASTSNLVAADHGTLGSTSQTGTTLTYANFVTGAYNDHVFNATGRGNVSKTGISKFGGRSVNYDVNANTPTWGGAANSYFEMYSADIAGTSNDPKLVVVYGTASFIPTVTWW